MASTYTANQTAPDDIRFWYDEPSSALASGGGNGSARVLGADNATIGRSKDNFLLLFEDIDQYFSHLNLSGNDSLDDRHTYDLQLPNCSFTVNDTSNGTCYNHTLIGQGGSVYNYWALVLVLFPIFTLFGNVLVILSVYRERTLQTVTNYFIVSLALADLLVAVVVMPFAVYVLLFVVLLALTATYAAEEAKKGQKRGVFGEGLALGGHDFGHDSGLSLGGGFDEHDFGGQDFSGHGADFGGDHELGFGGSSELSDHGPIDLGQSVHKHITITKKVGVPVPKPYPVTVEKKISVLVPHPVAVPVDKPYPVHVPKPYPVPVEKLVPYTVTKNVPYPVKFPVKVPFKVPVAVPVPKPYPVTVTKKVPVHIPEPIIVKKPVPVFIKSHHGEDSGLSFGGHGAEFGSGLFLGGHGGLDSGYGAGSEWKSW